MNEILGWIGNTANMTLVAVAVLGIFALLFMFQKPDNSRLTHEIGQLNLAMKERNIELREAATRADRAESLTAERKSEIDRLNGDLSKLRIRMDSDQDDLRKLTGQIESLKAKDAADQGILDEKKSDITRFEEDIGRLRVRLESEQGAQQDLKATIAALQSQIESGKASAEEKVQLLSKIKDDMQERFRQLADDALRAQGETFSKENILKLEATLTPLKEHVGHFEKELREVHQETVKDRERLKAETLQLSNRSGAISQEALVLTKAMKGDRKQQGAWGEIILEGILERSGLREGQEYQIQAQRVGDDGQRLRPDIVVNIPGGKSLIVDSKVSLNDYAAAVNAENEIVALASRKRHVVALRNHINTLSAKGCHRVENSTADYVIMFVPIEGALSEALREDGTLTQYALERHITIATPTTLMMALRTVAHGWAVEKRNVNADAIAARAGLLYDKVVGFIDNMDKIGKSLTQASSSFDGAMGQLIGGKGNVMSQVAQLKTLGAKASKSIGIGFEADDGSFGAALIETLPDEIVVESSDRLITATS